MLRPGFIIRVGIENLDIWQKALIVERGAWRSGRIGLHLFQIQSQAPQVGSRLQQDTPS
jgi:hypothetical protein